MRGGLKGFSRYASGDIAVDVYSWYCMLGARAHGPYRPNSGDCSSCSC